jgi:hypothetical protein
VSSVSEKELGRRAQSIYNLPRPGGECPQRVWFSESSDGNIPQHALDLCQKDT